MRAARGAAGRARAARRVPRASPARERVEPLAAARARSGTTSRAAAVGVEARTSAARSQSGVSCSWPTALTTGTGQAATARTTPLVARTGADPRSCRRRARARPRRPRARRRPPASASTIASGARGPWTSVSATTIRAGGKRDWIVAITSRFAAASLPVTRPIRRGSRGSGALPLGGEQPLVGELPLQPLERREVLAEAEALDRERAQPEVAALLEQLRAGRRRGRARRRRGRAAARRTGRAASSPTGTRPSPGP